MQIRDMKVVLKVGGYRILGQTGRPRRCVTLAFSCPSELYLAATRLKEVKSEVKEDNEILFFGLPKFLSKRSEGNLSFSPMS